MTGTPPCGHRAAAPGFTLIELLVVVAIMSILASLSVPLLRSLSESSGLTSAGQTLSDQIKLAVQTASSRGQVVEVRLIQVARIPGGTHYRAVQLWTANTAGTMAPAEKMALFAGGIAINESPQLSPLLGLAGIPGGTFTQAGASLAYVAFRVHPSGFFEPEPDATSKSHLYVTLLPDRLASASAAPANYLTVQVSPYTCAPAIYRP